MNLKKFDSESELVDRIVSTIKQVIKNKPDAVLCFACGETPRPVMNRLVELRNAGVVDFSRVRLLGLDEWIGVDRSTNGSCAQMLYDDFFTPMRFREDQISIFNGLSECLNNEISRMNQIVSELGIDFVLLGIGLNGHIGLNEPNFNPKRNANIVDLSEITQKVMTKYFDKSVHISKGITLGFKQLLKAKKIILMATGERKSEIVKEVVESEPSITIPATLLKERKDVLFMVDKEAGKMV